MASAHSDSGPLQFLRLPGGIAGVCCRCVDGGRWGFSQWTGTSRLSPNSPGDGLPVLSMRWLRWPGAGLRHPGFCSAGRGVATSLEPQAGIPNGEAVPGQEVVINPPTQSVNSRE